MIYRSWDVHIFAFLILHLENISFWASLCETIQFLILEKKRYRTGNLANSVNYISRQPFWNLMRLEISSWPSFKFTIRQFFCVVRKLVIKDLQYYVSFSKYKENICKYHFLVKIIKLIRFILMIILGQRAEISFLWRRPLITLPKSLEQHD